MRGVLCGLKGFGDDDRDRLPEESDLTILKHRQSSAWRVVRSWVIPVRQARCVAVAEDGQHTGLCLCVVGDDVVIRPRPTVLSTIAAYPTASMGWSAAYRAAPVTFSRPSTRDWGVPTAICGCAHGSAATVVSWCSTVRLTRSALNALSDRGFAPVAASSAAVLHNSGLAGRPVIARSTSGRRHGTVPTPPTAIRAPRTTPPAMSRPTVAEHKPNSYDWRSRTFR